MKRFNVLLSGSSNLSTSSLYTSGTASGDFFNLAAAAIPVLRVRGGRVFKTRKHRANKLEPKWNPIHFCSSTPSEKVPLRSRGPEGNHSHLSYKLRTKHFKLCDGEMQAIIFQTPPVWVFILLSSAWIKCQKIFSPGELVKVNLNDVSNLPVSERRTLFRFSQFCNARTAFFLLCGNEPLD